MIMLDNRVNSIITDADFSLAVWAAKGLQHPEIEHRLYRPNNAAFYQVVSIPGATATWKLTSEEAARWLSENDHDLPESLATWLEELKR